MIYHPNVTDDGAICIGLLKVREGARIHSSQRCHSPLELTRLALRLSFFLSG